MKRVALYARVSVARSNQTTENQLRLLQNTAARLGWTIVAVHTDEGISGAKGREKRPGYDALLKGVTRGEYDLVAAWSVCRLGRSLQDLVTFLADLQSREVGLYLHAQGLDSSTPSGRMMFGMISVFAEFERAMIRDRILAGLDRVRKTKRLGRPPMSSEKVEGIKAMLAQGLGVRETARRSGAGTATVQRLKRAMTVEDGEETVAA